MIVIPAAVPDSFPLLFQFNCPLQTEDLLHRRDRRRRPAHRRRREDGIPFLTGAPPPGFNGMSGSAGGVGKGKHVVKTAAEPAKNDAEHEEDN